MSTPSERFQKRKKRRAAEKASPNVHALPPEELIQDFLLSTVDYESVEAIENMMDRQYNFEYDINVSDEEVNATLAELHGKFNTARASEMAESCKNTIMASIIKPFGLGKFIAAYDTDGGNVTTIHNAQNGCYAKPEHEFKRDKYIDSKTQRTMDDYKKANTDANFQVTDEYTGQKIDNYKAETDHVVSVSMYHKSGGYMQNDEQKKCFARDKKNFALTERSINRSKRDQSIDEFEKRTVKGQLKLNKERFGTDQRRTKPAEKHAQKIVSQHQPKISEKTAFYSQELITTGFAEGAKMGFQQALGLVLLEFTEGIWSELKDIYNNGFKYGVESSKFFGALKLRFNRVSKKVFSRWKDVLNSFGAGAISGFFSNLITFIINNIKTTAKKINRLIREGFFSLLKAIKMVCFPPAGMTLTQAAHEATKLIAAGLTIASGIAVEEFVEKIILSIPVLGLLAHTISPVIVGILTGIVTSILVYIIDKVDIFGEIATQRTEYIKQRLEQEITILWEDGERLVSEFS